MRRVFLSISFVLGALASYSKVVINEFEPNNTSTKADPEFAQYADWIELFNNGTESVDLSGYYLTDNSSDTTQWKFPAGTKIAAGAYLLVWADDKSRGEHTLGLHTNFNLNSKGEEIALYSSTKLLLDVYKFGVVAENVSLGRSSNNAEIWQQYLQPTPGAANSASGAAAQASQPEMQPVGGFYGQPQTITLTSLTAGANIYYTTNGTNPTTSSTKYTGAFTVRRNTIVKAIAVANNYATSRIVSQTYFIGERAITLPVVSIGVDSLSMFDKTTGMYMKGPKASSADPNYGANFWKDIELPASFEYFVNGKEKVQVNAGISIHGGWSRRFEQRSFAIHCGDSYGNERMDYQFFKSKKIKEFKTIILKNSGSDVDQLKYRDGMINTLASSNMTVDYQAYQPTAVFINGRYWGILNIREKITENYLKNNYGLDSSELDLIYNYQEVYAGSMDDFNTMFDYVSNENVGSSDVYKNICSMIDIEEFIDYQITEIYVANYDWPGSNIRYWKKKGAGNKWRWILYDTDQSFAYYDYAAVTFNSMKYATTQTPVGWAANETSTRLLRRLLLNTEFKNLFIQRFAAHINSTFSKDSVNAVVSRIETILAGEKPAHLQRWGVTDSVWNVQYRKILDFANRRPDLMREFLEQYFGISSTVDITLKATNNSLPRFTVNGVTLRGNNLSGAYFQDIPFTLEAINEAGCTFVEWQDQSGKQISTSSRITVIPSESQTYVAVYSKQAGIKNVFINEFMASNTSIVKDDVGEYDDWIELYNANDYPVDLSGMYLTDDLKNPYKFLIEKDSANQTVIPAKGYILFWADEEHFQGVQHANFKLSADGESIGLCQMIDNQVYWTDSLSYKPQSKNLSLGRKTDAAKSWVTIVHPSPGASNGASVAVTEDEIAESNDIRIFPTVITSNVFVTQSQPQKAKVQIYSLLGNLVYSDFIADAAVSNVDVSTLPKGCYIIKIKTDNSVLTKQIFVE